MHHDFVLFHFSSLDELGNFSPQAIAGTVVGVIFIVIIAGAFIAAVIAFVLFSKKHPRSTCKY